MESPRQSGASSSDSATPSPCRGDHSGSAERAESAEKIILRWDSTVSEEARERMIFSGDRNEIDKYLHAVDVIQHTLTSSLSLSDTLNNNSTYSSSNNSSSGGSVNNNPTLQIAMARLEDEFRTILLSHSNPVDADSLLVDTPRSHRLFQSPFSDVGKGGWEESVPHSPTRGEHGEEAEHDNTTIITTDNIRKNYDDDGSNNNDNDESGSSSSMSSRRMMRRSIRSVRSIREIELIPSSAITDLRSIAERMITAGYLRECVQVYGSVRKQTLDSSFRNLGIEKLSIGDIQRLDWEALENKIRRWIKAAKVCVRTLFASEKRLSELIFGELGCPTATHPVEEACFLETVKGPAIQLFNFAEAISISRRSPEKLFKILDLHDMLADLLPDIDMVFESKPAETIRVQATEILSRLAEAARGILSEFENAVLREPSKVPVPGGTIHPLTRYVMNYVSLISDYKLTLAELIVSRPAPSGGRYSGEISVPEFDFSELEEERTPLAMHLIWIIVILDFNLQGKSQHYKDTALAHLFMMNNVHYIVQKIKGSPELRQMIGDEYLKKLTGKFRFSATNYQRSTWVKVLHCLRDEGLHVSGSFSSGVSKSVLRERFKSFNSMFEEVHRTQATWLVPDTQLKDELKISISEKVLPAYRSFLGRFRSHIENGRHPEQYIKYSWEDLDGAVMDLFEGNPVQQHLRRRSQ